MFAVATWALYLRVSGNFHVIVGILRVIWNVPDDLDGSLTILQDASVDRRIGACQRHGVLGGLNAATHAIAFGALVIAQALHRRQRAAHLKGCGEPFAVERAQLAQLLFAATIGPLAKRRAEPLQANALSPLLV